MSLKPLIGLLLSFLIFTTYSFSQPFLTVSGTSNLYISPASSLNLNSLVITPTVGFNLTANTVTLNSSVTNPYAGGPPILRSYLFSNTLSAFNGTISLYYKTPELNGLTASTLQLNGFTTGWNNYPSTNGANVTTTSGLSGVAFLELTLASSLSALPLNWLSVSVSSVKEGNLIQWTTTDETNTKHFQVLKSVNGSSWKHVGSPVPAMNRSGINAYSQVDPDISNSNSLYRVRQTDIDGVYSYSKTVAVTHSPGIDIAIYPNPATHILFVRNDNLRSGIKRLEVVNATGAQVYQSSTINGTLCAIATSSFARGSYNLIIHLKNGTTAVKSFVVQ